MTKRVFLDTALDSLALGEDVDQWTISAESSIVKSLDIYSQEPYMNIISKGTESKLRYFKLLNAVFSIAKNVVFSLASCLFFEAHFTFY